MAKSYTRYVCQNCGAESAKWIGRCPSCDSWNTYVEEVVVQTKKSTEKGYSQNKTFAAVSLVNVEYNEKKRIDTKIGELNRVLGGGLVPGSVVLLGGEPGIGKSTIALQVAMKLNNIKTLYISGEESAEQIKLRSQRLGNIHENIILLCETSLETILTAIDNITPQLIIVDSIQTLYSEYVESSAGSVSQIRECSSRLLRFAKNNSVPIILIGHIVKDGSLAGPKVLEHMVDTVLQFEGDKQYLYRILRSTKNRFGSTSEIGIFEMLGDGLQEVSNPSEILITHSNEPLSGIAVASSINGIRPYLIEIQALVSSAVYGTPQRSATGFDIRRLNMLLAVLEKRAGFKLGIKDVFLNIAGGLKIDDPSVDLAVCASILSSNIDIPIPFKTCFAGEISLSGEVRPVYRIEQRITEAQKLGFQKIIISEANKKNTKILSNSIEIVLIRRIDDLPKIIFK